MSRKEGDPSRQSGSRVLLSYDTMKMASFKMYLTAVVALILGTIFTTDAQSHVPVLLWESSNIGENGLSPGALSRMDVEEFADVLMRRVEADRSPVVILFVEDALSVEDFSRKSSGTGSPFPALQALKENLQLEFVPAVQTPMKALNRLSKLGYKWEQVSGEVLPEGGKKIVVVNLSDLKADEDRSAMLLRHDKHIASLYKRMTAVYPDILAVYTGRRSSWIEPAASSTRVRRETEPASSLGNNCNKILSSSGPTDQIMLYTSECPVLSINNTNFNLTSGEALSPDTRKGSHRMVVRYKVENSSEKATLRFRLNFTDDGYWQLTQAEYEDSKAQKLMLEPKSDIRAPMNFSYSCGKQTVFQNADRTVTLSLKNIKVQPGVQGGVFSPATDCIPFFTIPIWSGLFVTFLLLFIVAWGIDMMMNIHTMDRFDDPKGKPLVFSAQE